MGILGTLMNSGSALYAYQAALQVTSQNVANAGNPNYARQSPVLSEVPGAPILGGFLPGNGVRFSALQRHVDEALEDRLRGALGDQASALARHTTLDRIESVVNELSDTDLSTLLTEFFNSFSNLQNSPEDISARGVVLSTGEKVAQELRRQRQDLVSAADELNQELESLVSRANQIVDDIARLNGEVVAAEAGQSGQAGSLRDERDALLRELAGMIEITIREQPGGAVNVFIGNEPVVQWGISRGLTTTREAGVDIDRVTIRFADNNARVEVRGGQFEGMLASRDEDIVGQLESLDALASALIWEVNCAHADGQGLVGLTQVVSTQRVLDATLPLTAQNNGLAFLPQNGSFYIAVKNETNGEVRAVQVPVDLDGIDPDNDTSLEDLAAAVNAALNAAYGGASPVSASVTADNRLSLTASRTFSFTFGHDGAESREDSSHVLAALGINTFFNGAAANDIAVNTELAADPKRLAAAQVCNPGDGGNAGRLASLGRTSREALNGLSLLQYYNNQVAALAVKTSSMLNAVEAADVVVTSLNAQRESISGVSLDEEAIQLLMFQRSFQGSARVVAAVDELLQEMLNMVR